MVLINEWFPNPVGSDARGEWLELWNNSSRNADLSGWQLVNASGKKYVLRQNIGPGGYLILPKETVKITLRNSGEDLKLYDAAGGLESEASYLGSVPEGKSVSLVAGHYLLTAPTPGAENASLGTAQVAENIPWDRVLNSGPGPWEVAGLALMCGLMLAAVATFLYTHTYEDKDIVR